MKTIISVIVGVLISIGFLFAAGKGINYLTSGFSNHDVALFVRIGLWVMFITPIIAISIGLGSLVGIIFDELIQK